MPTHVDCEIEYSSGSSSCFSGEGSGSSDALLIQRNQDHLHEDLDLIIEATESASRLLGCVTSLSRDDQLRGFLSDILTRFAPLLRATAPPGMRVDVQIHHRGPVVVTSRGSLERIVLNLVLNAGEAGAEQVVVRTRTVGSEVHVQVEDNGEGMPPELIDRAGTPFLTTRSEGTGLGLFSCRAEAAQLGGTLEVNSTPEKGTIVTLRLSVG